MRSIHFVGVKRITCKLCLKGFTNEIRLERHTNKAHRGKGTDDKNDEHRDLKANLMTNDFHCPMIDSQRRQDANNIFEVILENKE
jgi:hypothetical protein